MQALAVVIRFVIEPLLSALPGSARRELPSPLMAGPFRQLQYQQHIAASLEIAA